MKHRFCSMPLTNLNSDVSILYILQNSEGDPSWCSLCGFEGSLPILLWARMQDCSFVSSLTTLVMHIIEGLLPVLLWARMQGCSFVSFPATLVMHIIDFMVLSFPSLFWNIECFIFTEPSLQMNYFLYMSTIELPTFHHQLGCLVELVVHVSEQMCFQCLNVLMAISKTVFINEFLWNSQKHIELFKVQVDVLLSHKNIVFILC